MLECLEVCFHLMPEFGEVFAVLHLGFQIRSYSDDRAVLEASIHFLVSTGEKMLWRRPHASSTTCQIFIMGSLLLVDCRILLIVRII